MRHYYDEYNYSKQKYIVKGSSKNKENDQNKYIKILKERNNNKNKSKDH